MMRQRTHHLSPILLLCIVALCMSHLTHNSPYYSVRTQTLSWPRIAGMAEATRHTDDSNWHGTFDVTTGYTRSFHNDDIVGCLFGGDSIYNDCECPFIRVSGSRIADRGEQDWLADYFGLPVDFKSEIFFRPRISNFIVDFNTHLGFNCLIDGAFLEIHAPFVHSKWSLGFRENIIRFGDADYDRGYFSSIPNREDDLVDNVTCFMSYHGTPRLNAVSTITADNLQDLSLTVTFNPLCYSRWKKRATQTRFSDIYFMPGFHAIEGDDYSLSIYGLIGAPAGTRPKGTYLFEPIVGNGHHPELGAGFTAHHHLFTNEDSDTDVHLYIDGHISHLFKTKQVRTFDLKNNGCNSRYMLAMKLGTPVENLFANPVAGDVAGSVTPSAQFQNVYTPVANLTTACVDVSVNIQGQATAMLNFHRCNLDIDLGYRFWGRTCERIDLNDRCPHPLASAPNTWALKGDAHVYGFVRGVTGTLAAGDPIALSGTQSKATIHAGTNNFTDITGNQGGIDDIRPTRNPGVDNAEFARAAAGAVGFNADILDRQGGAGLQTKTSHDPIFFNFEDINFDAARTKGLSHTLFFDMTYNWNECGDWYPYVGVGGKAEFSRAECEEHCASTDNGCSSSCHRCSPSEWGIWFKGGVSFH